MRLIIRAMVQAVSSGLYTAEDRVRVWAIPCEILGEKSIIGASFSPTSSGFPYQYHSTGASYSYEQQARWWLQFRDIVSPHWHKQHEQCAICLSCFMRSTH
jgi:hypothetical protein